MLCGLCGLSMSGVTTFVGSPEEAAANSFDAPVVVVGHSTGAVCALGAAIRGAPLRGLILYEPPWPHEALRPPTAHADEME